jgi:hypothetical protein
MAEICITHEGYEKSLTFWSENLNGKDNKTDISVDEKILVILICTLEKHGVKDVD